MGIRTGSEYVASLRDGRTIFVNGERVKDVTTYPQFRGIIGTLASLYDLQHVHRDTLAYRSPTTGQPVAASFLIATTVAEAEARSQAEEARAEHTFGLMGRLPDFCNALVTDIAAASDYLGRRDRRYAENALRYYETCRENDWCLTHTLVDPQIDRSKGPAEQPDPFMALRLVRETDRGLVVRGAKMLSTLAPFANEIWVGPFYPRRPGEEAYALSFALPMDTPGMKFICRETYDSGRGTFDRPLSSRFDEEDALAVFDDVEVPFERVFINRDVEIFNGILPRTPGYAMLQAAIRGMVKLRFLAGLACHLAETVGRAEAVHVQAQLGELVANAELVAGLVRAAAQEVVLGATRALPHRGLAATLWILIPQAQMLAVETLRQVGGSGLIMTPTAKDFANPEIAGYLEKYLQGKGGVAARDRVELFKLAWDMIGEPFGSRQLQYEWFYSGDPYFTRARFYHSPVAREFKALVSGLLKRDPQ